MSRRTEWINRTDKLFLDNKMDVVIYSVIRAAIRSATYDVDWRMIEQFTKRYEGGI